MSEVLQDEAATIFTDRRMLHVGAPETVEEVYDAPFDDARVLVALPHGCLVTPMAETNTLVQARVFSARPPLALDAEVVTFSVVGGQVIINNPLWAGPPGQIDLSLADGPWNVAATQTDPAGRSRPVEWCNSSRDFCE
ncbi:MAG: hypothetical protein ACYC2K_16855 [Gemmatimonadales bacterium]